MNLKQKKEVLLSPVCFCNVVPQDVVEANNISRFKKKKVTVQHIHTQLLRRSSRNIVRKQL